MTTFAALLAATLALAPADDQPATPKPAGGDRAKLQGSWSGKMGPQMIEVQLEVVGDKVVLTILPPDQGGQKYEVKGDYKIDETTKPKSWDFLNGKGSDDRSLTDVKAIYELDRDSLKLCTAEPGRDRPTEFKDASPQRPQIIVLTRVKPTTPPAKS